METVGTDTGEANYSSSGTVTNSDYIMTEVGDVVFVYVSYAPGTYLAIDTTLSGGTGLYNSASAIETDGNVVSQAFYKISTAAETYRVTATLATAASNRRITVIVIRSSTRRLFFSGYIFRQMITAPNWPGVNYLTAQSVPNNSIIMLGMSAQSTGAELTAGSGYTLLSTSDSDVAMYQINSITTSTVPSFTNGPTAYRIRVGGFVFYETPAATLFPANIRFPIRDANGNPTSTVVDMGDMFLRKEQYLTAGLWTWGDNNDNSVGGWLGLGDAYDRSSPSQVGTLTTWRQVSCGYRNLAAIKTDGTLWGASSNEFGVLGQNNTTPRSSPVQIGSMTNWKTVCSASQWMLALKTDGTIWTCGYNWAGQLGNDTVVHYSSPIQVGTLSNWKQIAVGSYHALAIKNDGSLWSWGEDTYSVGAPSGRLGLNYPWFANSQYSSPVQVGSLTNWKQAAGTARSSAAIKTDGTLWTWGSNNNNEMGNGNSIDYSSPVQIGSMTDWRSVSGGRFHMAAIKKDGTLWMWGNNDNGALGLGDTARRSSPVKVGALNNWKQVTCGDGWTTAVKTDGTLWSWGWNIFGMLGQGDTTSRSSPVQVGTLTSWKSTADGGCGYYWTAAIQSPDLP